ncbi:hypothetical protein Acsp02_59510 [Actinoplanes sp. NBRC 103695]|nr:hypothetical protein Acsp02_59510 [Actinoplanes sp. NBRC 103695]
MTVREPSAAMIEQVVRDAIEEALHAPLGAWPADRPLSEVPDAFFDSLARMDAIARIRHRLGAGAGLDAATGLDTIAAISACVRRTIGIRA